MLPRITKPKSAAEHAHATDRFAREIVGILKVGAGALAAADAQSIGPVSGTAFALQSPMTPSSESMLSL